MTDIPVIFSAAMVQALLAGRKTMTRRLAYTERKTRNPAIGESDTYLAASSWQKVAAGDRLWVREGWKPHSIYAHLPPSEMPEAKVFYLADNNYEPSSVPGRPSIHMPRWASRLTLLVTSTKTEPLQSISDDDCFAEGLEPFGERDPDGRIFCNPLRPNEGGLGSWAFGELWKHLHGAESWDANPLVLALGFRVIRANIDAPEARAA
ncbi:hypothetical protein J4G48_0015160 [Bradyrhizobium barranii subsp. apii]|uniref:hypothetical protein n=1 Tax=Bradyrhizobium barranii TaxID=2992140 RepID=UPI001AA145FD|nr:hypothetical protein [Bradyrhizobium barranii]UPT99303.1 hypothetical protein J4G48_0015160 [Bradyrhizobium barranii subsp. apii]